MCTLGPYTKIKTTVEDPMDVETHFDNMYGNMQYMESFGCSHTDYFKDNTDYTGNLNLDTLNIIKDYIGDEEYVSVAPLSRHWNCVWGSSPKTSRGLDNFTTLEKFGLFSRTRAPKEGRTTTDLISEVVSVGRLDILEAMVKAMVGNNLAWDVKEVCSVAAASGHLHILKWAKENSGLSGDDLYCTIVKNSVIGGGGEEHWHILEWVVENGWVFDEGEELDDTNDWTINWRMGKDVERQVQICLNSASAGKLDVFKWCVVKYQSHLADCDFDDYQGVTGNAVRGGNLDLLKFAVENECILDEEICDIATESGRLDILQWVSERMER